MRNLRGKFRVYDGTAQGIAAALPAVELTAAKKT